MLNFNETFSHLIRDRIILYLMIARFKWSNGDGGIVDLARKREIDCDSLLPPLMTAETWLPSCFHSSPLSKALMSYMSRGISAAWCERQYV